MPYPNEHSCRLRDPGDFQQDSFRRMKRGKLSIIIGRLKGKKTTTKQAYRYSTKSWTEAEAKKHCKENKGTFHVAMKEKIKKALELMNKVKEDIKKFL